MITANINTAKLTPDQLKKPRLLASSNIAFEGEICSIEPCTYFQQEGGACALNLV